MLVLLPLVLLNWVLRIFSGRRIPSLIVGPLDRSVFTPYEVRRHRLEHASDATHGFWKRIGDRIAVSPRRIMFSTVGVLVVCCAGFAFFSTDLTSEDTYREEVESVEGQHLLDLSFPSGTTAPTDIVVANSADVGRVSAAVERVPGVEAVSPPIAEGPTAVEFDVRDAAGWDSTVIPPLILLVVFLILIGLLRAVIAPLVLIGTVILSFLAALGVDYNIFLIARAREETERHGSEGGSCAPWR
ncbi:MAG TPA: MMPL family transporter [Solirubrobacterales bacterium]